MSFPRVTGSTLVIAVRGSDYTFYNDLNGKSTAIVLFSSVQDLPYSVNVYDADGSCGTGNREIMLSTTDVLTRFQGNQSGVFSSFRIYLNTPNASLNCYSREPHQWVISQTAMQSIVGTGLGGTTLTGITTESIQGSVFSISTSLSVQGSTILKNVYRPTVPIQTSLTTPNNTTLPQINTLTTSTGSLAVSSLQSEQVFANFVSTISLSTIQTVQTNLVSPSSFVASTLEGVSIRPLHPTNPAYYGILTATRWSTFLNGSWLRMDANTLYSTTNDVYSTTLPLLNYGAALSSLSTSIADQLNALNGGTTLSTLAVITSVPPTPASGGNGPGTSSLSTYIGTTLSTVNYAVSVSSLSSVVSYGLSSIGVEGLSSLSSYFSQWASSVASGPGLSSLSTSISLLLSSSTSEDNNTLSSMISYGVSDIATQTGVSSLSTFVSQSFSSFNLGPGLSSMSTYFFTNISTASSAPGLSSLSTLITNTFTQSNTGPGMSSLSSYFYTNISTTRADPGLSSLSTVFGRGISTVVSAPGVSSLSTIFGLGFSNTTGQEGVSSLSTLVSYTLSSMNTSPGTSSLYQTLAYTFSTFNDQEGVSSLSTLIPTTLSSIQTTFSDTLPSVLSTAIVQASTVRFQDPVLQAYGAFTLCNDTLYYKTTPVDSYVVLDTATSNVSFSTQNLFARSTFATNLLENVVQIQANEAEGSGWSSIASQFSSVRVSYVPLVDTANGTIRLLTNSNGTLQFANQPVQGTSGTGVSSLSTVVSLGLSSFVGTVPPISFSSLSTFISLSASTVGGSYGLSSLSTVIGTTPIPNLYVGASTYYFYSDRVLTSSISSIFNSTNLFVQDRIVSQTLQGSTLFTPQLNVSSLESVQLAVSSIFANRIVGNTLETLTTPLSNQIAFSTGSITQRDTTPSYASSLQVQKFANLSSLTVDQMTLFDTTSQQYATLTPFYVSASNSTFLYYSGINLTYPQGDPNNLEGRYNIVSSLFITASTSVLSSLTATNVWTSTLLQGGSVRLTQPAPQSQFVLTLAADSNNPGTASNEIYTSADGSNWTFRSRSAGGLADSVCIGQPTYNGSYWLVGDNGGIQKSTDGTSWSFVNTSFTLGRFPTWNGSYWVAGDQIGTELGSLRYSYDGGATWGSNTTGGFSNGVNSIAWNGSLWIAVGSADSNTGYSNIQYSSNGIQWQNATGFSIDVTVNAIVWTGKAWIAGGQSVSSNSPSLARSTDGINWSPILPNRFVAVETLAWNGSMLLVGGQGIGIGANYSNVNLYYSQDHGATWSISQGDGLGSSNVSLAQQEGAIRGFAWNGAQWLATGAQALATGQLFGTGYILMTSTEGITWTIVPSLYQANSNLILSGQKVGWSLNTTPALLTNHFSIVDQPLGYIPITSLSTNVLQVTPKGLHFNDSLTVLNAQSNTQKGRVGIHTTNPQYSLDIQGDWIVQNSTSFTTVWANLPNSNATTGFTNATAGVLGSTYMTSVVIHTANTGVARQVPLDIDLAGYPGLIRDNIRDNSAINSTIVQLTNTSVLPATDSGTPSRLWWQWINGTSQSTIGYAITGSVVPFTGQHAVDISGVSYDSLSQYVGLCVRSADRGYITKTLQGQTITGVSSIQSTEALPICEITRIAKDKAVFGVISDYENVPSAYDMSLISPYANRDALLQGRIRVNGLGDGAIWVTDEGGPIQVGDYLCTSEIVGHVKRQENPNTQYNYTVAKATMSCDFQLSQTQYRCETLTWNGQERKRAYLGCTYHCG